MEEPVIKMSEGLRDRVEQARDEYAKVWEKVMPYCDEDSFLLKRECLRLLMVSKLLEDGEVGYRGFAEELSGLTEYAMETKPYSAAFDEVAQVMLEDLFSGILNR